MAKDEKTSKLIETATNDNANRVGEPVQIALSRDVAASISSGLIAAVVAAITSLISVVMNQRYQDRMRIIEMKKTEYLSVIDALIFLRGHLSDLANTVSGRESEITAMSEEERDEMIRRDAEGASIVEIMAHDMRELSRIEHHLKVLGDKDVLACYSILHDNLNTYYHKTLEEALTSGRFIAADYRAAMGTFDTDLAKLEGAMQDCLGV